MSSLLEAAVYAWSYPPDVVSGPGNCCIEPGCDREAVRKFVGVENVFGARCELHRGRNADYQNVFQRDHSTRGMCRSCEAPQEKKVDGRSYVYCRVHRLKHDAANSNARRKRKLVMQNGGRIPKTFVIPIPPPKRVVVEY